MVGKSCMNLQGKDLVLQTTQKSARALVATALSVLLAKAYGVLPTSLELVGVKIDENAMTGAVFWVIVFQIMNHGVHWFGDFRSIQAWNSRERINGIGRWSAGSDILTKLDAKLEAIDTLSDLVRHFQADQANEKIETLLQDVSQMRDFILEIRVSAVKFRTWGGFYFFGWFFALPILLGFVAASWEQIVKLAA